MPYPAKSGETYPTDEGHASLLDAMTFWRASYVGGRKYRDARDANRELLLVQHEAEKSQAFTRRKRVTPVRNYCGPILRRYNDFVFRRPADLPEVEEGGAYAQLMADADGNGTPIDVYWSRLLLDSQQVGAAYSLITTNKPDGADGATAADAAANGWRWVLEPMRAETVVWRKYQFGTLKEVAVLREDEQGRFVRWYDDTYMRDYRIDNDGIVRSMGPKKEHKIAGLPVVEMRPQFAGMDESQCSAIADSQAVIFNIVSLLMEEMYGNTFTTWVISGVNAEGKSESIQKGTNRIITLPNPGATVNRIGSETAQADSLRSTIDAETTEIYRAAGVESGSPTQVAAPESGIAHAFRFNDLAANLAAMAKAVEHAHNTTMRTIYDTTGATYPGNASYPSDFDPPSFGEELTDLISALSANAVPAVVKRNIASRFIKRNITLSEEDEAQWEIEREQIGLNPGLTEGGFPMGGQAFGRNNE